MRVELIGEGTYPVTTGGVSTWAHQLTCGMPDVEFDVTVITAGRQQHAYQLPTNVAKVRQIDMWHPSPPARIASRRQEATFLEAWETIIGDCLGPTAGSACSETTAAWLTLAEPDLADRLWRLVGTGRALAVVNEAWARLGHEPISTGVLARIGAYLARLMLPLSAPRSTADVVHVTTGGSSMLAALPALADGVPVLLSEHGVFMRERLVAIRQTDWPPDQAAVVAAFLKGIVRTGYQMAEKIMPVSDFNARWAVNMGAPSDRVRTVHNGIDTEVFAPRDLWIGDRVDLVFLGRIDPLKDVATLIRALAIANQGRPGITLDIVGPIPKGQEAYAAGLRRLASELGLASQIRFAGPTTDPAAAYLSATAVVLPSVSEGFPYGALEPMALGRPVVATDVGGIPEAVGNAGLLVPARDPAAMAEALIAVLSDRGLRGRLASEGRERVNQQFTLERMLSQFRSIYREVRVPAVVSADDPTGSPTLSPLSQLTGATR